MIFDAMEEYRTKKNPGRILLLDDEDIVHTTLKRILEEDGYIIDSIYSADDALSKVKENYDLLISDIKLGGMDGIEVLRQIRMNKIDVEVIMLTGFATLDSATNAVNYGARAYVMKPIENLKDFRSKVTEAIHLSRLKKENEIILNAINSGKIDFIKDKGIFPTDLNLLNNNHEILYLLFQYLNELFVVINKNSEIQFCNLRFSEILESPYKLLRNVRFDNFLNPNHTARFFGAIKNIQQSNSPKNIQLDLVSVLQEYINTNTTIIPLFSENEYQGAILLIVNEKDSTKLKEKVELLATLFEESKYDMMFILNHDGSINICNALVRNTFGYTLNELMGLKISSLLKQNGNEQLKAILENIQRNGSWQGKSIAVTKQSVEFPVEISIRRAHNNNNNPNSLIICSMKSTS